MPRKRPLNHYPSVYQEIFLSAAKKLVVIPCKSNKAARNLRNQLYTYRYVVRTTDPLMHPHPDLAEAAEGCKLTIDGKELHCSPRDEGVHDEVLRAALEEQPCHSHS